jgi:hypothetical protein
MRTYLTQPLDLYIAASGNDSNPGTQVLPFGTHPGAWKYAKNNLDLAGNKVIFHSSGVTTDEGTLSGQLWGQDAPNDAVFRGDTGAIRKPTTGRCFAAINGARFQFENFTLDQSANDGQNDASTVTVGNGSQIWQGANVIFSNSALGKNYDVQAAFQSFYLFTANWTIQKRAVQTNASFSTTSNVIGVASPGGIIPYMSVRGVGNDACFVQSISGALVTLGGGNPGFSSGSASVTFSAGAAAHVQGDPFSFVYAKSGLVCTIYNEPYWIDGFLSGDFNAEYLQGISFQHPDGTIAPQGDFHRAFFDPHHGAVLDVGPAPPPP